MSRPRTAGAVTALYLTRPMTPPTRGAQRRLARQFREAALRATPSEAEDLERLERLVNAEAINVLDAHRILRNVIRHQHQRDQAKRAA